MTLLETQQHRFLPKKMWATDAAGVHAHVSVLDLKLALDVAFGVDAVLVADCTSFERMGNHCPQNLLENLNPWGFEEVGLVDTELYHQKFLMRHPAVRRYNHAALARLVEYNRSPGCGGHPLQHSLLAHLDRRNEGVVLARLVKVYKYLAIEVARR